MKPGALGGRTPPFTSTASRPRTSTPVLDKCANVPILACIFALIPFPLLSFFDPTNEQTVHNAGRAQLGNRILRPVAAQNFSRLVYSSVACFLFLRVSFVC